MSSAPPPLLPAFAASLRPRAGAHWVRAIPLPRAEGGRPPVVAGISQTIPSPNFIRVQVRLTEEGERCARAFAWGLDVFESYAQWAGGVDVQSLAYQEGWLAAYRAWQKCPTATVWLDSWKGTARLEVSTRALEGPGSGSLRRVGAPGRLPFELTVQFGEPLVTVQAGCRSTPDPVARDLSDQGPVFHTEVVGTPARWLPTRIAAALHALSDELWEHPVHHLVRAPADGRWAQVLTEQGYRPLPGHPGCFHRRFARAPLF